MEDTTPALSAPPPKLPVPLLPSGPCPCEGLPDWKDATWLSSNGVMTTGLPYAAVLIIRALAMNMLKNDFHFFNLILIPLLHVL